jgi:hypothetical protein
MKPGQGWFSSRQFTSRQIISAEVRRDEVIALPKGSISLVAQRWSSAQGSGRRRKAQESGATHPLAREARTP